MFAMQSIEPISKFDIAYMSAVYCAGLGQLVNLIVNFISYQLSWLI